MVLNSERIPIVKLPQSVISLDDSSYRYYFYLPYSINKTGYKMINPGSIYGYSEFRSPRSKYPLYKVFTTNITPASFELNVQTAVKNNDRLIFKRDRINRYSIIDRKNYIECEFVEIDENGKETLINSTKILTE